MLRVCVRGKGRSEDEGTKEGYQGREGREN
jgi:hypothetical protein